MLGEGNYRKQIYSDYNDNHLYTRTQYYSNGIKWNNWSTVALTTDNVASATKLQTAHTIWGQSFDGTGNVSGELSQCTRIYNSANNPIYIGNSNNSSWVYIQDIASSNGNDKWAININGSSWFKKVNIGYTYSTEGAHLLNVNGTARANSLASTNIRIECDNNGASADSRNSEINNYNNTLFLQYNTSNHLVCCNGGGNFGIGILSPAYKLHVSGNMQVTDFIFANRYASIPNSASIVVNKAGSYYLGIGSDGVNNTSIFGYCDANGNWEADYNMIFTFRGNILATGGITCYSSDQRAKTVIEQIKLSLKQIADAPTIRFKWNGWKIKDDGKTHIGGIAQYMQKLLPETVLEADNVLNLDYATTGYIFAVQTAKYLVKTDTEVERLKKRVKKLEKQLKKVRI